MNRIFCYAAIAMCQFCNHFIIALVFAGSGVVWAAPPVIPNYGAGNAVKDAQPLHRPEPREAQEPEIVEQETQPLTLHQGETLMVREFRLEGVEFIPEAELQAKLAPYQGRLLGLAEIQQAAAELTALYRSRGYLVARAYVPKQDATSGILTIRIIVGKYGKFTLDNQSLVNSNLLLGHFALLPEHHAVSRDDLERAMLLVDDLPGAALPTLTIRQGKLPGTSDFGISVPKDKRLSGYVLGDNLGSRFTGEYRLSGGVSVNSPLGYADQLNLRGLISDGTGLVNGNASYNFPLSDNGLRAEISAAVTTYELGSTFANLNAKGDAFFLQSTLTYPLIRSREESLYLSFGLAKKILHDTVGISGLATAREADAGTVSLRRERWGTFLGKAAYSNVTGGLTYGNLNFNDPAIKAFNRSGVNTNGDYARLNLDFFGTVSLAPLWSLNATVSLQKALLDKIYRAILFNVQQLCRRKGFPRDS
ncbi:MAG: POTRA domain-containing protein [Candidatus Paceibacterota bacterium]|jgi:hemolysin activation/secretion protein